VAVDRFTSRLFTLGLLLVAVAAAAEAAPKILVTGSSPSLPRQGSFIDNGSMGLLDIARAMIEDGYRLHQGMGGLDTNGSVVYLFAGPMTCSDEEAFNAAEVIASQASHSRVGVIVASSGVFDCGRRVLDALGLKPPRVLRSLEGAYIVLGVPGSSMALWTLYSPDQVAAGDPWRVAAWAVREGSRIPGVLVAEYDGIRAVYVPDWSAFSNWLVRAQVEAGLDPARAVTALVAYASWGVKGHIILPSGFLPLPLNYTRVAALASILNPGVLLAGAVKAYAEAEEKAIGFLASNPLLVASAAWLLLVPIAMLVQRSLAPAPSEIGEGGVWAGGRPWAEREAIDMLLRATAGVSVSEASVNPPAILMEAFKRIGVGERDARRMLEALARNKRPWRGLDRFRALAEALAELAAARGSGG